MLTAKHAVCFIENNHEAIIDRETWLRVQEMMFGAVVM